MILHQVVVYHDMVTAGRVGTGCSGIDVVVCSGWFLSGQVFATMVRMSASGKHSRTAKTRRRPAKWHRWALAVVLAGAAGGFGYVYLPHTSAAPAADRHRYRQSPHKSAYAPAHARAPPHRSPRRRRDARQRRRARAL